MAKGLATRSVDLEPIDRLEEKLKLLVGVHRAAARRRRRAWPKRTRGSRASSTRRATRLTEAEGTSAEMAALREERDQIRARVGEMLEQIESLNL